MSDDMAFEIFLNHIQFYPIPNKKKQLDDGKPKIDAHVVKLKMRKSRSIVIDGGVGSVGFITRDKLYLGPFKELLVVNYRLLIPSH
jgi:hypothetical protein